MLLLKICAKFWNSIVGLAFNFLAKKPDDRAHEIFQFEQLWLLLAPNLIQDIDLLRQ